MKLLNNLEVVPLSKEEEERYHKDFPGLIGLMRLEPGGWMYPEGMVTYGNTMYNFEFKPDDVLVMTWPKCGTTWLQEILWTMRHNPDLNNPLQAHPVLLRAPQICADKYITREEPPEIYIKSLHMVCPGEDYRKSGIFSHICRLSRSPRTLKAHLPFSFWPPNILDTVKVVYVVRDPKDTCLSCYNFAKLLKLFNYTGSLDSFVDLFVAEKLPYGPYSLHVKQAEERIGHPNLLFLYYEDLKADCMTQLKKIAKFTGADLTEEQLQNVLRHTSFAEMKKRDNAFLLPEHKDQIHNMDLEQNIGGFFRIGKAGGW